MECHDPLAAQKVGLAVLPKAVAQRHCESLDDPWARAICAYVSTTWTVYRRRYASVWRT